MNNLHIKCAFALLSALLTAALVCVPIIAVGDMTPFYAPSEGGNNTPSVGGGGPGNNNNSPSANGGGDGGNDVYDGYGTDRGVGEPYDGTNADYSGESESGEVLGVTDDSTATVGIVIAIIIAVAAIILIIALIPRGAGGM